MSDVALPGRLSGVVPSPQLTVIPVTVRVLAVLNVIVTVCPVVAGFGVGLLRVMVGTHPARTVVTEPLAWPVEPLLSVAVMVNVNEPATL